MTTTPRTSRIPRRPAVGLAATVSAAGLLLSACSTGADAPGTGASADAEPVAGGDLSFAITVDSHCIDPQQVGNNDAIAAARQTVASLTAQDPESGEILPWLAESWEVNDDASSYTFHLRDDAAFADGTPIDAAAVKTNFDAIVDLGAVASLGSQYLVGYAGTTVVDERTVTVDFDEPSAQFLQATSTFSLGLLSPDSAALSAEDRCAGKYVGSGPFAVKSYTQDQEIVLEKVTGYDWASEANDHTGEAYLDTVTFKVIPEASVRTGSLQSGQIDATAALNAVDLPQFDGNGFWLQYRANPGVVFNLFPNESSPLAADEAVRTALVKGIDRQQIVDTVLTPQDQPATGVLSHSTPLFEGADDLLAYDPEGAKKILDDAGWTEGADGIREKDGQKLTTTVTFWQVPEPLELVQQQLRQIGVDLQLKHVTVAESEAAKESGDFDFDYYNLTRSDADVLRTIFSATARNINQRSPEEVDQLLDDSAAATDPDERERLVTEASQLLIERGHAIPVYELSTTIAASDRVQGLTFEASSRLDFYDAWVTDGAGE
ncbi:ABC transporter substrate-binding protein [Krasilnikoviella flava]|uniref:Peptide/nickel transport system substrate-binding protein n=1 Tax=Krasilnikoviella flava TaxID=526729 RepID=A0A1T5L7G6_9MICO|nr:ABC transporter substrate-binding protein [Krasilnikoviella flava]SKC71880.1 peptide/nickel transport system substrate-binding protein [Krasilnikoviella flava]